MIVNQQQLQTVLNQNQFVPDEGPKAIPLRLDFSATDTYTLDMQNFEALGNISMIQCIFVDNSDNGNPLVITTNAGQRIIVKAGTQGYFPVLVSNPVKLTFFSTAGGPIVPLFLLNMPIAGQSWATS